MPPKDSPSPAAAPRTPRHARQQRRRDRSREEILEAARSVLLKKGLAAMTLDAVAREAGMSKTGLYYYFPSKDALAFELVFAALEGHASAINVAVAGSENGSEALGAIIKETIKTFAPRMDDFRLAFMLGQVSSAGAGSVVLSADQFARIRPLNDLMLGGASALLTAERKGRKPAVPIEPRLLAFLAYLAAIGQLTMKGLVEAQGDPLLYSDEQIADGFAKIFELASR